MQRVARTAKIESFKYDPLGRRIYKSSSSGTSVFAYDGDNMIEETNSSGDFLARLQPFLKKLPKDHKFALEIRNKNWLVPQFVEMWSAKNRYAMNSSDQIELKCGIARSGMPVASSNPMRTAHSVLRLDVPTQRNPSPATFEANNIVASNRSPDRHRWGRRLWFRRLPQR